MNKKLIVGLILLSALIFTVYLLWPSDESRIKKLFKEGAAALESRDLDGIIAKISFNYRDDYGMTYLSLKEALKREVEKLSDIYVEYGDLEIKVFKNGKSQGEQIPSAASDMATAELNVRVIATVGSDTGYILGDVKSPLHLKFTLGKERMKWLIIKTEGFEF